ncbi:hypothetical protein A9Q84_02565 [Halobacteriovorax marinus]|uniref:DUF2786 domain-containing protein n=1 Tax=Halobacteriovorax marinus TaxID=97084 RepID=A0A1Y5FCS7_9BACT|nr:hypothetical protein A9Q84_02565 [Halobacteriovorax marinus]
MQVYSKATIQFLKICKAKAKIILNDEMRLDYSRNRIKWKNYTLPLNFVVFEDEKSLGFFNHHLYQIGFNKRLLLLKDENILANVIRHELAHLETFLLYSGSVDDHGAEYREVCKSHNWNDEVYSSKIILEDKLPSLTECYKSHDKLKEKVKKLLSLSHSDNIHESHLATAKANELLLKFNLSHADLDEDETFLLKVMEGKRMNAKAKAIYEILTTFNVQPVFNHAKGYYYLEVIGARANVELADYVTSYLDKELDYLWELAKKENSKLKGMTAKNSFFRGVAIGYKEQITHVQQESFSTTDLIVLKKDLKVRVENVYSRLSYTTASRVKNHSLSSQIGKEMGKNLKIKKSLKNSKIIKLLR